jgi:hypothetical protein
LHRWFVGQSEFLSAEVVTLPVDLSDDLTSEIAASGVGIPAKTPL